jgi:hypothetical protein
LILEDRKIGRAQPATPRNAGQTSLSGGSVFVVWWEMSIPDVFRQIFEPDSLHLLPSHRSSGSIYG